jgi:hypothetical protein
MQTLHPDLTCCVLHVMPAVSGKGNNETVERFHALKSMLADRFEFLVRGFGFDGNSCFNAVHTEFYHVWTMSMVADSLPVTLPQGQVLIFSDPLHLLKRIRYGFVSSEFSIGSGRQQIKFLIDRIQKTSICSPVIFLNSRITKMHDLLSLKLFSQRSSLTFYPSVHAATS